MARTYRWDELTIRQQRAARKIAKDLGREGWTASPVKVGEHFRAAQLWSHGGLDTATFARMVQAVPALHWDVMTCLPKPDSGEGTPPG